MAALAAMMALAGCAGDDSDRGPDGPAPLTGGLTVGVTGTEYALEVEPRDGLIPARYTLVVRNGGGRTHALAIRGPGADERTPSISPGEDPVEIRVNLRPGRYELWCPVADHRDRGMQTSLLVEAL